MVFDVGPAVDASQQSIFPQKVAASEIFLNHSKIATSIGKAPASTPGPRDVGWTDEHSQDFYYCGQVPRNEENVPVPRS